MNNRLKPYHWLIFIICLPNLAFASSTSLQTQIARYLAVLNQPLTQQQNLLTQINQVNFPPNVKTISHAMSYWLQFSGYSLIPTTLWSSAMKAMMQSSLPAADHQFGPMTLEAGLRTLAGSSFYLLVDKVHRLVSFKLKPDFRQLYQQTQTTQSQI